MSKTEENFSINPVSLQSAVSNKLQQIIIPDFINSAGTMQEITLSYQIFGQDHKEAPVVMVNHGLTGNSQVLGKKGWWKELVGPGKIIDTNFYAVLCIDMPGNGFTGSSGHLIHNYIDFTLRDYAKMYSKVLDFLGINSIYTVIGTSIGGALAWELAVLKPDLIEHLIPVATDFKATDWVLAQCKVQDHILCNSKDPVHDARMHAMTFYRTPQSLREKFNRAKNGGNQEYEVNNWLSYHGKVLKERFQLSSYKLMNHLLTTIDISQGTGNYLEAAKGIKAHIHILTIDSDSFFLAEENWDAYVNLSLAKKNVNIHEIKSIHGHDAFLIEHRQVSKFLSPIFNIKKPQE